MTWERRWHGSVGYTLTGKDGTYCGYVGSAFPCDSQEDGWRKALAWLRRHRDAGDFLVRTFKIDVRFF